MHGIISTERLRSTARRPKSRTQNIQPPGLVFRDIVRVAFPVKPVAALGHLTGCSRSTIHTWLSGEHEPPAYVLAIVVGEIMRRLAGQ